MAEPSSADSGRPDSDGWETQLHSLGEFIRTQRQLANLSLRRLAELAEVSNPYLSQLERGLHEPSVRVLRQVANALRMPAEEFFDRLSSRSGPPKSPDSGGLGDARPTEDAIQRDPALSPEQKSALLSVYRSYVASNGPANAATRQTASHHDEVTKVSPT